MDSKKALIQQLKEFKRRLSRKLPIEKMILFGSRARGEFRVHSDVDLLIVSPEFKGVKSYKRPLSFYEDWHIDLPFEFICLTPEEFKEKSQQITIVREAVKEGIEIL